MRILPTARLSIAQLVLTLVSASVLVAPATAQPPDRPTATTTTAQHDTTPRLLRADVGLYPRAIRLAHSGSANGDIMASVVTFDGNSGLGAIYASHDNGRSFTQVGTVADPAAANGKGLCCATLYELPRRVGRLPAGTLLWSASAGQDSGADRRMSIRVWQSQDHGRTWSYLATPAVAANTAGVWEPEFTVAADGRLVVFYSDETDQPAHSQMMVQSESPDGVTWSAPHGTIVSNDPGARPGMANVRQIPRQGYLMTYEVCGAGSGQGCTVHYRRSADGVHWGDPAALGPQIAGADGRYLVHTPTISWTPGHGRYGRLFLVGQLLHNADGTPAPGNGRTVMVSDAGPAGPWRSFDAPVQVPDAFDSYCPNYSSTLVPVGGNRLLEIATSFGDDGVCRASYATGRTR